MVRSAFKERSLRYQLFLPRALSELFEALACRPGATKSSVLIEAERAVSRDRFAFFIARIGKQLASEQMTFKPEQQ